MIGMVYSIISYLTEDGRYDFLSVLKDLLKDKCYVALAFMTGVLPIAKDTLRTYPIVLNMFSEFSSIRNHQYSKYFGFTEAEVRELCQLNSSIKYEDLKQWYNGYKMEEGSKVYNSNSDS